MDKIVPDATPVYDAGPPGMAAELTWEPRVTKIFHFEWTDVPEATHYRLFESFDGDAEYVQIGDDVPVEEQTMDWEVSLWARVNAKYRLESCNAVGCIASEPVQVSGNLRDAIGYIKASNAGERDMFGGAIAISADGTTLAVGAKGERSGATGIDGNQSNNNSINSGAVYVFSRIDNGWIQQAYVKASNTEIDGDERFGAVALSADGNTMAVGSPGRDSNGLNAGAAYVFSRVGTTWNEQSYLTASNGTTGALFGGSVALSANGDTLAVGAAVAGSGGAAYLFSRSGASWTEHTIISASNGEVGDGFGNSLALSGNGNLLVVGAPGEDANGSQNDNSATSAGAVYAFTRMGNTWSQQAYLKAQNVETLDYFGGSMALSSDGATLAVVASGKDNSAGAAYVFTYMNATWQQQAYLQASNSEQDDQLYGGSVALSADGSTLAIGAIGEDSDTVGMGTEPTEFGNNAGAAYVFSRQAGVWSEKAYVKARNTDRSDGLGSSVALSGDGLLLGVGATNEAAIATEDQYNNSAPQAGAVYLY